MHSVETINGVENGLKKEQKARKPWKRAFLTYLQHEGNVSKACEVAGISLAYAYKIRNKQSRFAEAWKNALRLAHKRYVDGAEAACKTLGTDGYLEPVFQGGVLVGHKRKYIPELLKFRLAGEKPRKYSRKTEHHVSANLSLVTVEARHTLLSNPEAMELACRLAALTCTSPSPGTSACSTGTEIAQVQDVVAQEQGETL